MARDYTDEFTTYKPFASRNALLEWVRHVGNENKIVIVVKRSDSGLGKKNARVLLACERGGVYRRWTGKMKVKEKEKRKKVKKETEIQEEKKEEESK